ncbi:GrpB family protein [Spirosoma knui]
MPIHPVTIEPYNPDWPKRAQWETGRLSEALRSNLLTVEHIGSTAIPGLAAKPIIDLMPIVNQLDLLDQQRPILEGFGYEWYGEHGISQRRFCILPGPSGTSAVHLHIFPSTSVDIDRHVAFRDYLRSHPTVAQAYQEEKLRAAKLHPFDSLAYNQEKADWVLRHEAKALSWFNQSRMT